MPPKKKVYTCQICGYRAIRENSKKRMFMAKFPLDEDRCRQWVKLVGKEDLAYVPIEKLHTLKYICGDHFRDRDFNKKKNRLKRSAIPSKNLKADPLLDEMLVNFPSHVCSDIYIVKTLEPSAICDSEVSQSRVEGSIGTNKTAGTGSVAKLEQAGVISDHPYCKGKTPQLSVDAQPATKDGSSKLDGDVIETDDPIETDADFDNDSPPSPVPEIRKTHEDIFSWQKTELIEADASEHPTPTPVLEKPILPDDVVTLSLFCEEPDPPIQSEPSAPVAAVPEGVKVRCKDCAAVIDGFSFWCVQCLCGALCVACAASETHYAHYVLRSPKGATQNQTEAVLAVIRRQLVMENLLTLYDTDGVGVKVEIKYEPEETATPDPLAVGPHPDPLILEVEPHPDTTVKKCVDEETDQHTFKRLRLIDSRTRIPNSTVRIKNDVQQKLLMVPANVLRKIQTAHTLSPGATRSRSVKQGTTSNIRTSQLKYVPHNILRGSQRVHTLTSDDLKSRGVKLVTSSKIGESQVLIATASNLRRSKEQTLKSPIRGSQTVQALTAGDLKSQHVIQATSSRVSEDDAHRPMRDPRELMLRRVTSEVAVQMQPLTTLEIRKWIHRKRRRKD